MTIKTRTVVFVALLICCEVILTRFLSFQTPIVRISFGFLPIALTAILFGPLTGGFAAALGDIIGMIVAPQGIYFPGFTASAFITGFVFGLFLYKKPVTIGRIFLAVLTNTVIADLFLSTIWVSILTGNAVVGLIIPRLAKSAVMFPIQIAVIFTVWRYLGRRIQMRIIGESYAEGK